METKVRLILADNVTRSYIDLNFHKRITVSHQLFSKKSKCVQMNKSKGPLTSLNKAAEKIEKEYIWISAIVCEYAISGVTQPTDLGINK